MCPNSTKFTVFLRPESLEIKTMMMNKPSPKKYQGAGALS
jgi:hypothetical protein